MDNDYLWVWSGPAVCQKPALWSPWCQWWHLQWWQDSRCTVSPCCRLPPTPQTERAQPDDIRETLSSLLEKNVWDSCNVQHRQSNLFGILKPGIFCSRTYCSGTLQVLCWLNHKKPQIKLDIEFSKGRCQRSKCMHKTSNFQKTVNCTQIMLKLKQKKGVQ